MLPVLRQTYDDLLAAVQAGGGADLLISQILIFAAPLVAEKTGIRWISTELQPGAFMSAYDPPVLAPTPFLAKLRPLGRAFHRALFTVAKLPARLWIKPVKQLRRELGLLPDKDPIFAGRNSPHLVLALFSRVLAEPQPDWAANTLVTGFPFYDENGSHLMPELAQFLDEGEPPIVFTLGSSAIYDAGNFYVESLAAAQKLGKRAVLLVGDDPLNQPPEPLPKNIIAAPYAPYAKIFPRASVVVHQGGVGTTGQALRAGKPMLVMPFGGDQYDNGARVERLGAGYTIMRKQYRADRVAAQLKRFFDNPSYRETAANLARRVSAENGVRVACDAIEEQLNRTA
jgi:rhamnosyltransferase subunit B